MTLVLRSSASKNYELLPQAGIQARSNDAFGPSSVLPPAGAKRSGGSAPDSDGPRWPARACYRTQGGLQRHWGGDRSAGACASAAALRSQLTEQLSTRALGISMVSKTACVGSTASTQF